MQNKKTDPNMNRRVMRRVGKRRGKEKIDCPESDENLSLEEQWVLDWTKLPDDTVIQLFSCLNYRDRASLSSTCRSWWTLGKSPCLWQSLDLTHHKFDSAAAASLASRCESLQKLRFRVHESAEAIINLRAKNLRQICGDSCKKTTDAALSVIAARHESLECLVLDLCERVRSDAVKAIAVCCPKLRKLRLAGMKNVDACAINALANNCCDLTDIGFSDCRKVNETALGNVASVRFLSVAGTSSINWDLVVQHCSKLPNLTALDVSRTDITPTYANRFLSSSISLKVLCALNCPFLEEDASFASNKYHKGKVVLALFTDILKGVATLFVNKTNDNRNVFLDRRNTNDRRIDEFLNWLEWSISTSLLGLSVTNYPGLDNFWLNQGKSLLISFMQSPDEDIQETAATTLATFVVIDEQTPSIGIGRAEAFLRDGGIPILLNLARSWREGLQLEAAKAIANLTVSNNVAKAVANGRGIDILVNLSRSVNRFVAEEAAGGLWNLAVGKESKVSITEAGGVKALVDLILKWSRCSGGEGVLERAVGALANLALDEKCSMEVARCGGLHSIATLARNCKFKGVQEQAARALANLGAHGDSNESNAAVGHEGRSS